MDSRKIQEVGGGTFTVSLPRNWAATQGLSQGTLVDVFAHVGGQLTIEPHAHSTDSSSARTRVADGDSEQLKRLLRAAYAAGVDELRLEASESFSADQRRAVMETGRNLAGLTTESASDSTIVAQVMLDTDEVSIAQVVRQLRFTAVSMHQEAIAAWTTAGTTSDLTARDDQADRLYALVDRCFERAMRSLAEVDALGVPRSELVSYWVTARELERVADHAERIATRATAAGIEIDAVQSGELSALSGTACDIVERAVSTVVGDADTQAARTALDDRTRLREEVAAIEERVLAEGQGDPRVALVLTNLRRTAEHGGNIAERCIQASFQDSETPADLRPRSDSESRRDGVSRAE